MKEDSELAMDPCVSCGKDTEYPVIMNIDYRYYYVEGVGQLCKECYDKIYNKVVYNPQELDI